MLLSFITWNIDPVLLHLGPLEVRWYGLLWAVGIYIAYLTQVRFYRHEHCPEGWTDKLFMWIVIGTILGARLGHCWFYEWHQVTDPALANYCHYMGISTDPVQIFGWTIEYRNPYIEHPFKLLKIWEGGLASHGGAIGIILASILLSRYVFQKDKIAHGTSYIVNPSWLWILDRLCIGAALTGAAIRLGNLFNSEIYGGPTTLPWGFIFVRDGQTVPCHPTQIYEMLYCLVTFGVCWWMYWRRKAYRREGLLIGTFFTIVFGTRFVLEFIKNNQEAFEANHLLNMGQLLSIPFVALGIYLIIRAYRRPLLPDTANSQ